MLNSAGICTSESDLDHLILEVINDKRIYSVRCSLEPIWSPTTQTAAVPSKTMARETKNATAIRWKRFL
jgi:hypothetical protein